MNETKQQPTRLLEVVNREKIIFFGIIYLFTQSQSLVVKFTKILF